MQRQQCDECKKIINEEKHEYVFVRGYKIRNFSFNGNLDFCGMSCFIKYYNRVSKKPKIKQ
jgi:hypothetical protein